MELQAVIKRNADDIHSLITCEYFEYRNKGCNFSVCLLANKSFVMRSHKPATRTNKGADKNKTYTEHHFVMPISAFFISFSVQQSIQTENNVQNFYQNHNHGDAKQKQRKKKKTTTFKSTRTKISSVPFGFFFGSRKIHHFIG